MIDNEKLMLLKEASILIEPSPIVSSCYDASVRVPPSKVNLSLTCIVHPLHLLIIALRELLKFAKCSRCGERYAAFADNFSTIQQQWLAYQTYTPNLGIVAWYEAALRQTAIYILCMNGDAQHCTCSGITTHMTPLSLRMSRKNASDLRAPLKKTTAYHNAKLNYLRYHCIFKYND